MRLACSQTVKCAVLSLPPWLRVIIATARAVAFEPEAWKASVGCLLWMISAVQTESLPWTSVNVCPYRTARISSRPPFSGFRLWEFICRWESETANGDDLFCRWHIDEGHEAHAEYQMISGVLPSVSSRRWFVQFMLESRMRGDPSIPSILFYSNWYYAARSCLK